LTNKLISQLANQNTKLVFSLNAIQDAKQKTVFGCQFTVFSCKMQDKAFFFFPITF